MITVYFSVKCVLFFSVIMTIGFFNIAGLSEANIRLTNVEQGEKKVKDGNKNEQGFFFSFLARFMEPEIESV